jgi:hypothetical protein
MLKRIIKLLKVQPSLKANDIARDLGVSRKPVNQVLHKNPDIFVQDETFHWALQEGASFELELISERRWITQEHFERALDNKGSPLDSNCSDVLIKITDEQPVLLCAAARILALSNQLVMAGKRVVLDFTNNNRAVSYLSRACFFARLNEAVEVLPTRPPNSDSERYMANNLSIVELLEICPEDPENNVPSRIKQSFVDKFGHEHSTKLFTLVAEMVSNVEDHSETMTPGFAGLQVYSHTKKKKISVIVVISDSGIGICASLRPALETHFPDIARKFPASEPSTDPQLIIHAMEHSGLSRLGKGRGAGFHTSHGEAATLDATVTIRQENFAVNMKYKNGSLHDKSWDAELPKIIGTHIVFEFFLTVE